MFSSAMFKSSYCFLFTTLLIPVYQISTDAVVSGTETPTNGNASSFHMSFDSPDAKIRRRDTTYITSDGYLTTDHTQATVFYIDNDMLYNDANLVSANANEPYIPFAASQSKLLISTVWTHASMPIWSNKAFAGNGIATYCQGADNRIYIVMHSPPIVCKPVAASKVPLASSSTSTSTSVDQVSEATSIIDANKYQAFCSDYLDYTTPLATSTVIANVTANATAIASIGTVTTSEDLTIEQTTIVPSVTETQTITPAISYTTSTVTTILVVTQTLAAPVKIRGEEDEPHQYCQACEAQKEKRIPSPTTRNVTVPSPLSAFASDILSSACSLEATSVTSTSTVYITDIHNETLTFTTTVPALTETDIYTTSETTTISDGASIVLTTVQTPVSTVISTYTSTSTISVPYNAPSGTITWLAIDPAINPGAGFAVSDNANHMTDNYYTPTKREVFIITKLGQLYSVTNNAYYYPGSTDGTDTKLYWSTSAIKASTLFSSTVNATNGETQLGFKLSAVGAPQVFCVSNLVSKDDNTKAGYHVHFAASTSAFPANCLLTHLFLVPTS